MIQKLIDAYELKREMCRKCIDTDEETEKGRAKWDSGLWIRYKVFEDAITLAPRVDTERHGHWVENNGRYGWFCSQCKKENNYAYDYNENNVIELQDHYCPNCGAKMDESTQKSVGNALEALDERGEK